MTESSSRRHTSVPCRCLPAPSYTEVAQNRERLLHSAPSSPISPSTPSAPEYVYKTDHVQINLGRSIWGTFYPTYGRDAIIEGFIEFRKQCTRAVRVTIELKGSIINDQSRHATLAAGLVKKQLISQKLIIFSCGASSRNFDAHEKFLFSLPFPNKVDGNGGALPPSFATSLLGVSSEVSYSLVVTLARRGLWADEMRTIPIIYLPKSHAICPTPIELAPFCPDLPVNDQVKRVEILPIWSNCRERSVPSNTQVPDVHLFLPSPQCFASGDLVPLALSITCLQSPVVCKLFSENIGVSLIKRKTISGAGEQTTVREHLLTTANLTRVETSKEGWSYWIAKLLQAGAPGCDASWSVDGVLEVSYFIRVTIRPPENVKHLPTFRHDELVELTTDRFGMLEREMLTTGGVPVPALGLGSTLAAFNRMQHGLGRD